MAENENTAAAKIVAEALGLNAQKALNDAVEKYGAAFGSAGLAFKSVQIAVSTLMGIIGYDNNDDDAQLKETVAKMVEKSITMLDDILEEASITAPSHNIPVPEDAARRIAKIAKAKAKQQGVKLDG